MDFLADVKFLGVQKGEGQRGTYYDIAVSAGVDSFKFRTTLEVFRIADSLQFGDDVRITLQLRQYQGDWVPRVMNVEAL